MPYRTRAAEILEQWREAEPRYNDATDPGARTAAHVELHKLKAEYQEVVAEAAAAHAPTPEPFPGELPDYAETA